MKQALEKKLGVVFGSVLVLVFLIGVFQCQTITKLADADRQVARSRQALDELTVLGLLLDQTEIAAKASLTTTGKNQLRSAAPRISESLHRLRGLWADDPGETKRLDSLDSLLTGEMARQGGVTGKSSASSLAHPVLAAPVQAQASLEAARPILRTMQGEERLRLQNRAVGARVVAREAVLAATIGSGLAVWLLVLSGLVLRHYVADRRRRSLSQALSSQLLENMAEGVWLSDESGPILYANPACEAAFGYEQGELPGMGLALLVEGPTPGEASVLLGEIQRRLETGVTWKGELTGRRKDGSRFYCYARITALDLSGHRHWLAVQEEVSEPKPDESGWPENWEEASRQSAEVRGRASAARGSS